MRSILDVVLMATGITVAAVVAVPGQSQSAAPAAAAAARPPDLDAFLKSLPPATPPALDPPRALWLTAAPLGCLDELHPRPTNRPYFWQGTFRTIDSYDKTRAFYGCRDWTTAAGATWSLITLAKRHPALTVDGIVREKLTDHLGKTNLEGELAYIKESPNFQRPLGHAWFLKLYSELLTWKDPEAESWAASAAPMARFLSEGLRTYLAELERPNRSASMANTAIALDLALDYVAIAHDSALERAIRDTARRFYANDKECATADEAKTAEPISPCLAVAVLMARVTDRAKYPAWLDTFLPEPPSEKFAPLTSVSFKVDPAGETAGRGAAAPPPAAGGGRGGGRGGVGTPHATWTTLTFSRADAFQRIALALPPADRRREAFLRLSAIHAQRGIEAMREPAVQDSPVPGTTALRYMAAAAARGIEVVDLTVATPKPSPASSKPAEYRDVDAFLKTLPATTIPALDEPAGAGLAAMSLSCLGRPHARPGARAYLWETTYQPPDDFERNRAFYGCFDWHSAVNSTWALVKLLRMFPDNATAPIIRQKLNRHLGTSNIEGEVTFFKTAGQFEVPYGYAWTLKLQGELMSWNDPDAAKWAAALAPLSKLFSERLATYFKELERPVRTGVHPNSAFAIHLMYDYLTIAKDDALKAVVLESAKRYYAGDTKCKTADEPAPSDFLSPCLTEAAVMSRVMDRAAFVAWLDKFLPPPQALDFRPLTEPLDPDLITNPQRLAQKSHVIGLAFLRADAMNVIAAALPPGDARIPALRKLAAMHAARGLAATHVAGYYGSHFLSSMTILYYLSSGS
jgi:hypothetical protein